MNISSSVFVICLHVVLAWQVFADIHEDRTDIIIDGCKATKQNKNLTRDERCETACQEQRGMVHGHCFTSEDCYCLRSTLVHNYTKIYCEKPGQCYFIYNLGRQLCDRVDKQACGFVCKKWYQSHRHQCAANKWCQCWELDYSRLLVTKKKEEKKADHSLKIPDVMCTNSSECVSMCPSDYIFHLCMYNSCYCLNKNIDQKPYTISSNVTDGDQGALVYDLGSQFCSLSYKGPCKTTCFGAMGATGYSCHRQDNRCRCLLHHPKLNATDRGTIFPSLCYLSRSFCFQACSTLFGEDYQSNLCLSDTCYCLRKTGLVNQILGKKTANGSGNTFNMGRFICGRDNNGACPDMCRREYGIGRYECDKTSRECKCHLPKGVTQSIQNPRSERATKTTKNSKTHSTHTETKHTQRQQVISSEETDSSNESTPVFLVESSISKKKEQRKFQERAYVFASGCMISPGVCVKLCLDKFGSYFKRAICSSDNHCFCLKRSGYIPPPVDKCPTRFCWEANSLGTLLCKPEFPDACQSMCFQEFETKVFTCNVDDGQCYCANHLDSVSKLRTGIKSKSEMVGELTWIINGNVSQTDIPGFNSLNYFFDRTIQYLGECDDSGCRVICKKRLNKKLEHSLCLEDEACYCLKKENEKSESKSVTCHNGICSKNVLLGSGLCTGTDRACSLMCFEKYQAVRANCKMDKKCVCIIKEYQENPTPTDNKIAQQDERKLEEREMETIPTPNNELLSIDQNQLQPVVGEDNNKIDESDDFLKNQVILKHLRQNESKVTRIHIPPPNYGKNTTVEIIKPTSNSGNKQDLTPTVVQNKQTSTSPETSSREAMDLKSFLEMIYGTQDQTSKITNQQPELNQPEPKNSYQSQIEALKNSGGQAIMDRTPSEVVNGSPAPKGIVGPFNKVTSQGKSIYPSNSQNIILRGSKTLSKPRTVRSQNRPTPTGYVTVANAKTPEIVVKKITNQKMIYPPIEGVNNILVGSNNMDDVEKMEVNLPPIYKYTIEPLKESKRRSYLYKRQANQTYDKVGDKVNMENTAVSLNITSNLKSNVSEVKTGSKYKDVQLPNTLVKPASEVPGNISSNLNSSSEVETTTEGYTINLNNSKPTSYIISDNLLVKNSSGKLKLNESTIDPRISVIIEHANSENITTTMNPDSSIRLEKNESSDSVGATINPIDFTGDNYTTLTSTKIIDDSESAKLEKVSTVNDEMPSSEAQLSNTSSTKTLDRQERNVNYKESAISDSRNAQKDEKIQVVYEHATIESPNVHEKPHGKYISVKKYPPASVHFRDERTDTVLAIGKKHSENTGNIIATVLEKGHKDEKIQVVYQYASVELPNVHEKPDKKYISIKKYPPANVNFRAQSSDRVHASGKKHSANTRNIFATVSENEDKNLKEGSYFKCKTTGEADDLNIRKCFLKGNQINVHQNLTQKKYVVQIDKACAGLDGQKRCKLRCQLKLGTQNVLNYHCRLTDNNCFCVDQVFETGKIANCQKDQCLVFHPLGKEICQQTGKHSKLTRKSLCQLLKNTTRVWFDSKGSCYCLLVQRKANYNIQIKRSARNMKSNENKVFAVVDGTGGPFYIGNTSRGQLEIYDYGIRNNDAKKLPFVLTVEDGCNPSWGVNVCENICMKLYGEENLHLYHCRSDNECFCVSKQVIAQKSKNCDTKCRTRYPIGKDIRCGPDDVSKGTCQNLCERIANTRIVTCLDKSCYCVRFHQGDHKNRVNPVVMIENKCQSSERECFDYCSSLMLNNLDSYLCDEKSNCICVDTMFRQGKLSNYDLLTHSRRYTFPLGTSLQCHLNDTHQKRCEFICYSMLSTFNVNCDSKGACFCQLEHIDEMSPNSVLLIKNSKIKAGTCNELCERKYEDTEIAEAFYVNDRDCACVSVGFKKNLKKICHPVKKMCSYVRKIGKIDCHSTPENKNTCYAICKRTVGSNQFVANINQEYACVLKYGEFLDRTIPPIIMKSKKCKEGKEFCWKACMDELGPYFKSYVCTEENECFCVTNSLKKEVNCSTSTGKCTAKYPLGPEVKCGPFEKYKIRCNIICQHALSVNEFVMEKFGRYSCIKAYFDPSKILDRQPVISKFITGFGGEDQCKISCEEQFGKMHYENFVLTQKHECFCVNKFFMNYTMNCPVNPGDCEKLYPLGPFINLPNRFVKFEAICKKLLSTPKFRCNHLDQCWCVVPSIDFRLFSPIIIQEDVCQKGDQFCWKSCLNKLGENGLNSYFCRKSDCYCITKHFINEPQVTNLEGNLSQHDHILGPQITCGPSEKDKRACDHICLKTLSVPVATCRNGSSFCSCRLMFRNGQSLSSVSEIPYVTYFNNGCVQGEEKCVQSCLKSMLGKENLNTYICQDNRDCICVGQRFYEDRKLECANLKHICTEKFPLGPKIDCMEKDHALCSFLCQNAADTRDFSCYPEKFCTCNKEKKVKFDNSTLPPVVYLPGECLLGLPYCEESCSQMISTSLVKSVCYKIDCYCVTKKFKENSITSCTKPGPICTVRYPLGPQITCTNDGTSPRACKKICQEVVRTSNLTFDQFGLSTCDAVLTYTDLNQDRVLFLPNDCPDVMTCTKKCRSAMKDDYGFSLCDKQGNCFCAVKHFQEESENVCDDNGMCFVKYAITPGLDCHHSPLLQSRCQFFCQSTVSAYESVCDRSGNCYCYRGSHIHSTKVSTSFKMRPFKNSSVLVLKGRGKSLSEDCLLYCQQAFGTKLEFYQPTSYGDCYCLNKDLKMNNVSTCKAVADPYTNERCQTYFELGQNVCRQPDSEAYGICIAFCQAALGYGDVSRDSEGYAACRVPFGHPDLVKKIPPIKDTYTNNKDTKRNIVTPRFMASPRSIVTPRNIVTTRNIVIPRNIETPRFMASPRNMVWQPSKETLRFVSEERQKEQDDSLGLLKYTIKLCENYMPGVGDFMCQKHCQMELGSIYKDSFCSKKTNHCYCAKSIRVMEPPPCQGRACISKIAISKSACDFSQVDTEPCKRICQVYYDTREFQCADDEYCYCYLTKMKQGP